MMKKAFTMLELVFVIVIIGILAAVIVPNTRSNPAPEAAVHLQNKIAYAQHLAQTDDKYDATNVNWYKERWQIVFVDNNYTVMSNGVAARDPMDTSVNMSKDLGAEYGVTLGFGGDCPKIGTTMFLSFDNQGRPLVGDLANYTTPYMNAANEDLLDSNCTITITGDGGPIVITVVPETGFVSGI